MMLTDWWEKIKSRFKLGDSAVNQLLFINVVAFFIFYIPRILSFFFLIDLSRVIKLFYLPADFTKQLLQPWTWLTYMFLHASFNHILYNMLFFYFIANILEGFLGGKRIWRLYLMGGILGGLFFVLSYNIFPVFKPMLGGASLVGASAAVLAIVVAAATYLPEYSVRLFGIIPIKLKWLAIISIALDFVMIEQSNPGGHLAHLGGALYGFLYVLDIQGKINLPQLDKILTKFKRKEKTIDERKIKRKRRPKNNLPNQDEVDAILDKISQKGYNSLSKEEKDTLFRASK
tara:strand:+ start:4425 stop:5288 length:864 start_codon:yes stop_codon:yes gene_type:complete